MGRLAPYLATALLLGSFLMLALPLIPAAHSLTPAITVVSNDPDLKNPLYITTDGTNLYVDGVSTTNLGSPPSCSYGSQSPCSQEVWSIPIGGGSATRLYSALNPSGITVIGANLYWTDPNSGPITDTQILAAPKSGAGPVTAIYTGSSVGQPIVDGSGLTNDGTLLYAADMVLGGVFHLTTSGGSLTSMGTRWGGFFSGENQDHVAESSGVLYLSDCGSSSISLAPGVVSIPTTGGSFTTLASGSPMMCPTDITVGNGELYVVDGAAGNTIWELPTSGGTPTALVSGSPFVSITGAVYFDGALYVTDTGAGIVYKVSLNPVGAGVPEFPAGALAVFAVAIPVLIFLKGRYARSVPN